MPRAFDDKEREILRERLLETGERLFGRYGLKKTTVEELARETGISKGAFYSFFASKELLFFEILERIQEGERETLRRLATQGVARPSEGLAKVILHGLAMLENYPLLKVALQSEEFDQLLSRLPEERVREEFLDDQRLLREVSRHWSEDYRLAFSPEVATGLIRSVFFLAMHAAEIAPDHPRKLVEALADVVAAALFERRSTR
jgi:AcrR family transcriptional regulator